MVVKYIAYLSGISVVERDKNKLSPQSVKLQSLVLFILLKFAHICSYGYELTIQTHKNTVQLLHLGEFSLASRKLS